MLISLRKRLEIKLRKTPAPIAEAVLGVVSKLYKSKVLRPKPDKASEKIISNRYSFILLLVPKAASFTLLRHLYFYPTHDWNTSLIECPYSNLTAQNNHKNYYKIAFVRNPWHRVVSCYKDKIQNPTFTENLRILCKYKGIRENMPFDTFVEWLALSREGSDLYADRHWLSQHKFFEDHRGRIQYDFLVRLETLESDLNQVFAYIGAPQVKLPTGNSTSPADSRQYEFYYDATTSKLIGERYAKDIQMFGFSKQKSEY